MSKLYLNDNKFMNWPGWQPIKWIFGILILAVVLWVIWSVQSGGDPVNTIKGVLKK